VQAGLLSHDTELHMTVQSLEPARAVGCAPRQKEQSRLHKGQVCNQHDKCNQACMQHCTLQCHMVTDTIR
jgi:hypothetical protein